MVRAETARTRVGSEGWLAASSPVRCIARTCITPPSYPHSPRAPLFFSPFPVAFLSPLGAGTQFPGPWCFPPPPFFFSPLSLVAFLCRFAVGSPPIANVSVVGGRMVLMCVQGRGGFVVANNNGDAFWLPPRLAVCGSMGRSCRCCHCCGTSFFLRGFRKFCHVGRVTSCRTLLVCILRTIYVWAPLCPLLMTLN